MATAYIALGANLGERRAQLTAAAGALTAVGSVDARSPLFETDAVAEEPQPPYLNAVVRVRTTLPPRALLDRCLEIERGLGRQRPPGSRRAPRTIDLDLLLYDQVVLSEAGLSVPHPELLRRAFVRIPLARVATPALVHPITGERLDRALADRSVRELAVDW